MQRVTSVGTSVSCSNCVKAEEKLSWLILFVKLQAIVCLLNTSLGILLVSVNAAFLAADGSE